MLESLSTPKEWSKISRKLPGRTQHQIKNRFICVLSSELGYTREKIRDFIKKNEIIKFMKQTLMSLNIRKQQNSGISYDAKNEIAPKSEGDNTNNSSYEGILPNNEEIKMDFFGENDGNWFPKEESEDLFAEKNIWNVYNFINFDL